MAKIIFGSWMVRYPLGGNLSWALQYLLGLKDLGHDVYLVEKAGYDLSCFDAEKKVMTNDCSYGIKVVSELLSRFGLGDKWCYVDSDNNYYGINENTIQEVFKGSDLFIDSGSHGSWAEEAERSTLQVLIDGEPGYTQMKWANNLSSGKPIPVYDRYYTNGKNVGRAGNPVPTLGLKWGHIYSPVKVDIFRPTISTRSSPYSTVMNWQSRPPITFQGKTYGQKDIEFQKFLSLPLKIDHPIEVAVPGREVPFKLLEQNGWLINSSQKVTISFDSFQNYLNYCRGEFSVCKNVFVENKTGWFSDKSAAYLASGRPVVLQDTGFGSHLPVGNGLFAVSTLEEAVSAIKEIENDYTKHSKAAREIAGNYLEAKKVMGDFLQELGIG